MEISTNQSQQLFVANFNIHNLGIASRLEGCGEKKALWYTPAKYNLGIISVDENRVGVSISRASWCHGTVLQVLMDQDQVVGLPCQVCEV